MTDEEKIHDEKADITKVKAKRNTLQKKPQGKKPESPIAFSMRDVHTVHDLIQQDPKSKLPLVLYILSLIFLGVFGIILGLGSLNLDKIWTIAIHEAVVNSSFNNLFIIWTKLLGGAMACVLIFGISLIIVVIPRKFTKKIVKYAGLFVISGIVGLVLNRILMGLSTRFSPIDNNQLFVLFMVDPLSSNVTLTEIQPWFMFFVGSNPNSWITGAFPSFLMTFAGLVFGFPYCFNSLKTRVWKVISSILAIIYVVFMGIGLIATYQNWLSDIIFAGVLQYWITAIVARKILTVREQELTDVYDRVHLPVDEGYRKILKAKSVLNYTEIPFLLEHTKAILIKQEKIAKDLQEKGKAKNKDVPYLPNLTKSIEILTVAISKMPNEKAEIPPLLNDVNSQIDGVIVNKKISKELKELKENLQESLAILADNKKVALKHLDEAIVFYKKAIEAAKHEPGDFKYAIEKAESWLSYTNRFKEGLIALSETSGDEFQKYMKENFLYII